MFVEIKKEEGITPITVDVWIKKSRVDGFTPKEAMQVLKWSNFYGNIKLVIKEISRCETLEERLAFKEFVLSAVDGRKVTPEVFEGLFRLAQEGGYAKELLDVYSKEKIYGERDINVCAFIDGITNIEEYKNKGVLRSNENLSKYDIFIGSTKADFEYMAFRSTTPMDYRYVNYPKRCKFRGTLKVKFDASYDYSQIEILEFRRVNEVDFSFVKKMPKNIDVSDCDTVNFDGVDLSGYSDLRFKVGAQITFGRGTKFPEVLDLSMLDEVNLSRCDLGNVKEVKFKKGAKVRLNMAKNLPANIDFSGLKKISLNGCDLANIKEVRFCEGADVDLSYAKNIPSYVDISKLSKVDLTGSNFALDVDLSNLDVIDLTGYDLSNWDSLNIKEGAKVCLHGAKNFPKKLDLSKFCVKDLGECDFSGVEEIIFGEVEKINLVGAENLPEVLDFSSCSEVNLSDCDLSKVKEIKFKNCTEINFTEAILPEKLDLSDVRYRNRYIEFCQCDFSHVKEIIFSDDAKAEFSAVKNFPVNMDLSKLKSVSFISSDLRKTERIKFKEDANVTFY